MTREQAINYLFSSGFTNEQVGEVVRALTYEPTPKNDLGVDCIDRKAIEKHIEDGLNSGKYGHDAVNIMTEIHFMPSVTPQLSVPEVTALAEWTEKLTKASEEAYNKGYADGMKAQEPRKGHWINTNDYHCYNDGDIETIELRCSCCNEEVEWDIELLHKPYYCENCGADMRGVKE